MSFQTKRIYDDDADSDGKRILVDRLWPRGISKEEANLDEWMKKVAPSDELRSWFDHDPDKWDEFCDRYQQELAEQEELLEELRDAASEDTVTLLYAAKDREHNNAVALKHILEDQG